MFSAGSNGDPSDYPIASSCAIALFVSLSLRFELQQAFRQQSGRGHGNAPT
jgi:hypothetical protein